MARSRTPVPAAVITDARVASSDDIERRQKRYLVTMLIRTSCFAGMYFTHGITRWSLLLGAALLPGFAVVLANARDNHSEAPATRSAPEQPGLAALTAGTIIPGEVHEDPPPARG